MNITFPSYFDSGKFGTLEVNNERFVDYAHKLDYIKHVQLTIQKTFLVYVFEGIIEFIGPDGKARHVHANEGAVVPKGEYIMSEELSSDGNKFKALLFFLSEDIINEFKLENNIIACTQVSSSRICFIHENPMLKNYVDSVVLLSERKKSKSTNSDAERMKLKVKELLYYLYDLYPNQIQIILNGLHNSEQLQIQQIVESNYLNNFNLDELAFLCGMSLSSFKRKFEKIYETTPAKWIKNRKLEKASQLLIKSDLSISEIAYDVGFSSHSHFIQSFKDKFNVAPSEYKNTI